MRDLYTETWLQETACEYQLGVCRHVREVVLLHGQYLFYGPTAVIVGGFRMCLNEVSTPFLVLWRLHGVQYSGNLRL